MRGVNQDAIRILQAGRKIMIKHDIEKEITQKLSFQNSFIKALAALAGAGLVTRKNVITDVDSTVRAQKVNAALAGNWIRIGKNMQHVMDDHNEKHKQGVAGE